MEIRDPVKVQPRRFYDGGVPAHDGHAAIPPNPDEDPRIVLERISIKGDEQFMLARRIAYRDRHLGELLVPGDLATFSTDLTSVPALFTWLVPKTGAHLPAALLHDGLISPVGEPDTYVSTEGHRVDRVQADRVFRDAMADTGTGVVRRWLVWSAVTLGTVFSNNDLGMTRARQWRYRIAMGATLAVIIYLGLAATFDLVDRHVPGFATLPWMGDRRWYVEMLGGGAGAVAIPFVLGLGWGRFRVAGWVDGIALALLIHVTVLLVAVTAVYQVTERVTRKSPMAARGIFALGLVVAVGVFLGLAVTGP